MSNVVLSNQEEVIRGLVEAYFSGLHHGDTSLLEGLFHPDCVLKSPDYRVSRAQWLSLVADRPVPSEMGHPWQYSIQWIEWEGAQAMVKVSCPLPHANYVDYLGLLWEEGRWLIVNKMYAPRQSGSSS